jgi:putative membrane protein (TIGR04086 family)
MQKNNVVSLQIIKGVIISLIISLCLVLIFALFIKLFSFSDATTKPINYVIKIVAVFVGGFLAINGDQGFLKGVIIGVVSLLTAYLLFGVLGGGLKVGVSLIWEILLGATIGAFSGIIAVNFKNKRC